MKNGRFMMGLVGVGIAVTYLVWTGVSEAMVYAMTPSQLIERVEADPSFAEMGVRVAGRLVRSSYSKTEGRLLHHFTVRDDEYPDVTFPVEYDDALPDTFFGTEDVDVVVEGRFNEDGVFVATLVLAKCGSRYEAASEALTAG